MINVAGKEIEDTQATLLQTLELNSVAPTSHCKSGFCGACRTKLLKGKVEYIEDPIGFMNDGEILPCVCRPVGDIEIDVTFS